VQIWHRKREWFVQSLDRSQNTSIARVTPLENPAVNGPWICNKGRDLARILERTRAVEPLLKGRPVGVAEALDAARRLIGAARHPVALVSNWGSNEELEAFKRHLGEVFHARVKRDWQPQEGERLEDDLLIRADKNPNSAKALELFEDGEPAWHDGTDLVLVWGEGYDFARIPARAKIIFLNAYLQPENGHADVFLPVSIQTERAGHYTNFQGVVSRFEPCFPKGPAVLDAEAAFAALAVPARGHA
jgi:NADH-quinone oxidoreductase subunit G